MENWKSIQELVDNIMVNLQHTQEKAQKDKISIASCKGGDSIGKSTTRRK